MSFGRELDFKVGNGFFRRIWVSSPASTKSADGLGPLFNARSCQSCHIKDGRGHAPSANWPEDGAVSMFLRLSIPPQNREHRRKIAENLLKNIPDPTYGIQLQDLSTQNQYDSGRGVIGVYDVKDNYRLLETIPSHGIGSYEIKLLSEEKILVVANGGILTHPETGRQ